MVRGAMLVTALFMAAPALAEKPPTAQTLQTTVVSTKVTTAPASFALPLIDYSAPGGAAKAPGILIGRDIAPNATVGLGFFKLKPRYTDNAAAAPVGKSKKISVGLSLRF